MAMNIKTPAGDDGPELALYTNVSVGTGKHANNPWLQELPDPISKICWDNYAAVSPKLAKEMGLEDGQLIRINDLGPIPVAVQPGQEYKTISVALGYGRVNMGVPGETAGKNAYPLVELKNGSRIYRQEQVKIEKTAGTYELARTQSHHSMEGRRISLGNGDRFKLLHRMQRLYRGLLG